MPIVALNMAFQQNTNQYASAIDLQKYQAVPSNTTFEKFEASTLRFMYQQNGYVWLKLHLGMIVTSGA
ncbi:hypothetical protein EAF04_002423 [Stromatinia cepivora]|nr:hypothetical protein EAF04_002423 [Stromatinia cepivora]